MHFDEAVQYLFGLGHEVLTMKLGLRNTEQLLEALQHPEKSYAAVQIAGTNGKGSVAAILESICRRAGISTGLYTSPHLTSITERIRINGVNISPDTFAAEATTVRSTVEQLIATHKLEASPTFFEQVTVIGLNAFRDAAIDLAILETGLGGRLDSTTAARAGVVAITPISFDHQEYLGHTLPEIAQEKAAIIHDGARAVIGPQLPEALQVLLQQCRLHGVAPVYGECETAIEEVSPDGRYCVTFQTRHHTYRNVWLGLRGRHQIENAAIAVQIAEELSTVDFAIPDDAIAAGVAGAIHPGRLELIPHQVPVLLDGAHNVAGAGVLRDYLEQFGKKPLTIIFGCMDDKPWDQMGETLFPLADHLILTKASNPRSALPEKILSTTGSLLRAEQISVTATPTEAFNLAFSKQSAGMICVTGSLYLIGELRTHIINALPQEQQ